MKEDFRNWSFAYRNRTKRKTKNWRVSSFFFSSSFFPSVGTQSREKSMPVRKQWRGHAYICPVNAIQLYSHVSIPDCALFILLNDTRLGRNGVRHPYPSPPCYGHVKFSWPSFIEERQIDDKVEIKSRNEIYLFENVLNNSVKSISISEVTNNFEGLIENKRG